MDDFVWLFLDIDIPVCRDFILLQESKAGTAMTNSEAERFLSQEFKWSYARSKVIVDTIKGERPEERQSRL